MKIFVRHPLHMLIDTSKMKTVAAQMVRLKRWTKYEKDMFRMPSAQREYYAPVLKRPW